MGGRREPCDGPLSPAIELQIAASAARLFGRVARKTAKRRRLVGTFLRRPPVEREQRSAWPSQVGSPGFKAAQQLSARSSVALQSQ